MCITHYWICQKCMHGFPRFISRCPLTQPPFSLPICTAPDENAWVMTAVPQELCYLHPFHTFSHHYGYESYRLVVDGKMTDVSTGYQQMLLSDKQITELSPSQWEEIRTTGLLTRNPVVSPTESSRSGTQQSQGSESTEPCIDKSSPKRQISQMTQSKDSVTMDQKSKDQQDHPMSSHCQGQSTPKMSPDSGVGRRESNHHARASISSHTSSFTTETMAEEDKDREGQTKAPPNTPESVKSTLRPDAAAFVSSPVVKANLRASYYPLYYQSQETTERPADSSAPSSVNSTTSHRPTYVPPPFTAPLMPQHMQGYIQGPMPLPAPPYRPAFIPQSTHTNAPWQGPYHGGYGYYQNPPTYTYNPVMAPAVSPSYAQGAWNTSNTFNAQQPTPARGRKKDRRAYKKAFPSSPDADSQHDQQRHPQTASYQQQQLDPQPRQSDRYKQQDTVKGKERAVYTDTLAKEQEIQERQCNHDKEPSDRPPPSGPSHPRNPTSGKHINSSSAKSPSYKEAIKKLLGTDQASKSKAKGKGKASSDKIGFGAVEEFPALEPKPTKKDGEAPVTPLPLPQSVVKATQTWADIAKQGKNAGQQLVVPTPTATATITSTTTTDATTTATVVAPSTAATISTIKATAQGKTAATTTATTTAAAEAKGQENKVAEHDKSNPDIETPAKIGVTSQGASQSIMTYAKVLKEGSGDPKTLNKQKQSEDPVGHKALHETVKAPSQSLVVSTDESARENTDSSGLQHVAGGHKKPTCATTSTTITNNVTSAAANGRDLLEQQKDYITRKQGISKEKVSEPMSAFKNPELTHAIRHQSQGEYDRLRSLSDSATSAFKTLPNHKGNIKSDSGTEPNGDNETDRLLSALDLFKF